MEAGSLEAIVYEFFHFIDEIGHCLNLDNYYWYVRFCKWAHREDGRDDGCGNDIQSQHGDARVRHE